MRYQPSLCRQSSQRVALVHAGSAQRLNSAISLASRAFMGGDTITGPVMGQAQ